jgi:hypothetical protein
MNRNVIKDETRNLINQIESKLDWYFADLKAIDNDTTKRKYGLDKSLDQKVIKLKQNSVININATNKKSRRISSNPMQLAQYRPTA